MKLLLTLLILSPFLLFAQEPGPVFAKDTLYTTCGYTIYKGRVLQVAAGTGKKGTFRFIRIRNGISQSSLQHSSIVVKEFKKYEPVAPGESKIVILGSIVFKDRSIGTVEIEMMFDRAIENVLELPGELTVPDQYRNNSKVWLMHDLDKLLKLYALGAINKIDYEYRKNKLLEQTPLN